jgi:hypothetical protein
MSSSWRQPPSDPRTEIFFPQLSPCGNSPYEHPLSPEDGSVSYEYAWPSFKRTYRTYSMSFEILPFALYIFCQYKISKADHAYLTYLMLQRQLSHLNGRKLDNRQV